MEKKNKRYECCRLSPFSSPPSQCSFGPLSRRRIINSKMKNILRPRRMKQNPQRKKKSAASAQTTQSACQKGRNTTQKMCLHSQFYLGWPIAGDFPLCQSMSRHSPFVHSIVLPFNCASAYLRVCVGLSQYEMVIGCTVFSLVLLCNNLHECKRARAYTPEQVRHKGTTIKNATTVQVKHLWHLFFRPSHHFQHTQKRQTVAGPQCRSHLVRSTSCVRIEEKFYQSKDRRRQPNTKKKTRKKQKKNPFLMKMNERKEKYDHNEEVVEADAADLG